MKRPGKELKRCPLCNSSNIYRRVRISEIEKASRKKKNKIDLVGENKVYRCNRCKYEFNTPKEGYDGIIYKTEKKI